jgi:hypothetical protein
MKYESCLECRHNASTNVEKRDNKIYCAFRDGKDHVEVYEPKDGLVLNCPLERKR